MITKKTLRSKGIDVVDNRSLFKKPAEIRGIRWKEAMLKEFKELHTKVNRIDRFLYNGLSAKLEGGQAERIDLVIQRYAMHMYLDALGRRCERHGIIPPAGRIQNEIYNPYKSEHEIPLYEDEEDEILKSTPSIDEDLDTSKPDLDKLEY